MNILYTITWPNSASDEQPRQFYEQLRAGAARGVPFPFDTPYEVGLVHVTETPDATPPAHDWAVAIMAMSVATEEMGAADRTLPVLENWFKACAPEGIAPGAVQTAEASHLKLESELRTDYEVVSSFGTFVGEPEADSAAPAAPPKPALTTEMEALKAVVNEPLAPKIEPVSAAVPPPVPPPPPVTPPPATAPATANDSNTLSTCVGIGFMAAGVLLIPVSILLAALFAMGQFSTNPETGAATTTTMTDFVLILACCPLPLLIMGIGLILLGVFLPRWIKQNQARPVIR